MTREEAIEELKNIDTLSLPRGYLGKMDEALKMAIEALQTEHCGKDINVTTKVGRWIDKPASGAYIKMQSWCSVCGQRSGIGGIESNRHKPYCPNCGSKMEEGE